MKPKTHRKMAHNANADEKEEVILETREDLTFFLKNTPYDYVILKFYADWCKPVSYTHLRAHET